MRSDGGGRRDRERKKRAEGREPSARGFGVHRSAVPAVPPVEFAADGEAGPVDGAGDEDVEVAVAVLDEDVRQVLEADEDAATLADPAARPVQVGEVDPDAHDV